MIFHMLNQLTYQDWLNSAAVNDLECACHLATQSVPFVGGRIGAQKRTADYIFGLAEFIILCRKETRVHQPKAAREFFIDQARKDTLLVGRLCVQCGSY